MIWKQFWLVWCIPSPSHIKWLKIFEKTLSQWKYTICYQIVIDVSGKSCLDLFRNRVIESLSDQEKNEFRKDSHFQSQSIFNLSHKIVNFLSFYVLIYKKFLLRIDLSCLALFTVVNQMMKLITVPF